MNAQEAVEELERLGLEVVRQKSWSIERKQYEMIWMVRDGQGRVAPGFTIGEAVTNYKKTAAVGGNPSETGEGRR